MRGIAAAGLVLGTAGNASGRDADSELIAVSPTSVPYESMRPEDVSVVTPAGDVVEGAPPSFELPMHLGVLTRRRDVGGVVHTHSPYATALGCLVDEIPVVGPEQAATVGGAITVVPYAPSGEPSFADAVLAGAPERWAVIVRNHGPVCLGRNLAEAFACAFAVEDAARVFALARVLGEPSLLPAEEVQRVARLSARLTD